MLAQHQSNRLVRRHKYCSCSALPQRGAIALAGICYAHPTGYDFIRTHSMLSEFLPWPVPSANPSFSTLKSPWRS